MEVARSVKRGSRRGAKAGVSNPESRQVSCIHLAMGMFADEQPSLALLGQSESDGRSVAGESSVVLSARRREFGLPHEVRVGR
jgi:hypothetical protein